MAMQQLPSGPPPRFIRRKPQRAFPLDRTTPIRPLVWVILAALVLCWFLWPDSLPPRELEMGELEWMLPD